MKSLYAFLRGGLVLLVLVGAFAALISVATVFFGIDKYAQSVGGWEYIESQYESEVLINLLTDSGVIMQKLDAEEPLLAQRMILINEGINEVTARHVVERLHYLNSLDSEEPIELLLNTSGGWMDSAFAIIDTMRAIKAKVNVTALGGCYSAGTLILAAGTGERTATPNTVLSVHVNDYYRDGDEYNDEVQDLARFRRIYKQFTNVPQKWFDEEGDQQYYFDAEKALRMELIDKISEPAWKAPVIKTLAPAA